ncbi:MAG TPA: hypothetical protein VEA79_04880 [Phenylobacterium sp.]|nr:hypothetical protein [Phenylobacterium sp.]
MIPFFQKFQLQLAAGALALTLTGLAGTTIWALSEKTGRVAADGALKLCRADLGRARVIYAADSKAWAAAAAQFRQAVGDLKLAAEKRQDRYRQAVRAKSAENAALQARIVAVTSYKPKGDTMGDQMMDADAEVVRQLNLRGAQ